MKLSTTKLVLFMVFVVCLVATKVTAKHHHKDCDDDDHEDWDDDWKDDHGDWDNDNDWDNNDWDSHPSSTLSSGWPVPTFGQSTAYYPPGAPATVTATYTQVYTATGVPTAFPNQPQYGSLASVTSVGVPITFAAIMFTMVIVA
ncbi:hypothetical protein MAM1_0032c02469 [Mucor ambiguus]|uniref:Uncharacterized protein n=1 Tax=Mucor ambiguus TaxID=91626 RepID=A0A0C9M7L5_9FUNG|nr:hypothetical protein MAM1_0032c02469 [Mucor ambiguus]